MIAADDDGAMPTGLTDRRFLFLLASARLAGNSEWLAQQAALALAPTSSQQWLRLSEHPLTPFEDLRHSIGVYPAPTGHQKTLFEATLACTDLVLVAPVYWYSLPAAAKLYLDYWSAWMRVPGAGFLATMAGKNLSLIAAVSGSDDDAAPSIGTLQRTARYCKMNWHGALLGNASKPGDIMQDHQAIANAKRFFQP
jgi:NAD(P)H-dependent FMN reductase